MNDVVISAKNISKTYQIGRSKSGDLRQTLIQGWQRLRHLRKYRSTHNFQALQNINFEVKKGEVIGIIGKNGAGKSTLLKIISKITRPTTGRIELRGRVASLLEVGTGFHPELTGRENIFLNGSLLGMRKQEIKEKFDAIVDFSGVEKFIDTPVKRYSSGMYVRLAFAVAAHLETEILLIDEILAVGDLEFQKKCLGKMDDVSKSGSTILFVSHNMAAIENLCTKAMLIDKGEMSYFGGVGEAIEAYKSKGDWGFQKFYDLSTIQRSKHKGSILFKSVQLNKAILLSGEFFQIKFQLMGIEQSGENLLFGIILSDAYGQDIVHLSNTFLGEDSVEYNANCFYQFSIPNLNLKEGIYNCRLYLSLGDVVQDWLKDVFAIQVWGNSYNFPNNNMIKGLYHPKYSFEIC